MPGSFGFQHPETTPPSIPTKPRTAPATPRRPLRAPPRREFDRFGGGGKRIRTVSPTWRRHWSPAANHKKVFLTHPVGWRRRADSVFSRLRNPVTGYRMRNFSTACRSIAIPRPGRFGTSTQPALWTIGSSMIAIRIGCSDCPSSSASRAVCDQEPGFGFSRQYKTPGRVPEG